MSLYLWQNEQWIGPYSQEQIQELLKAQSISEHDFVWDESWLEGRPVGDVPELAGSSVSCSPPTAPEQTDPETYKFWAFISYSHADKKWADWLHHALETYRVPAKLVGRETERNYKIPKRIFPVFRDREELPGSSDLGDNINRAIQDSRFLVVICSPRSAVSRWVNEEIISFKALGRENRVLSLIVDGEPNATDRPDCGVPECFPEALRYRVASNREILPERTEPIAADARPGKDGKRNTKLKLLAGILGVNFDELRQRDKQRRRQRVLTMSVCSLIAILGVTALVHFIVQQRFEAQHKMALIHDLTEAGREALLAGDAHAAADNLGQVYNLDPGNAPVQLMLNAALAGTDALLSDQEGFAAGAVSQNRANTRMVASANGGGWNIVDLESGKIVKSYPAIITHEGGAKEVILSPSGQFAFINNGEAAWIDDLDSPRHLDLQLPPNSLMLGVVFDPESKTVHAAVNASGKDSELLSWDTGTGTLKSTLHLGDPNQLNSLLGIDAANQRAAFLRTTTDEATHLQATVMVFVNLADGNTLALVPMNGYQAVKLNASGDRLIRTNLNSLPQVYDLSGNLIYSLSATGDYDFHWNPSGKTLVSRNKKGATVWDAATGKSLFVLQSFPGADESIVDPQDRWLALAVSGQFTGQPSSVSIYDLTASPDHPVTTIAGGTHASAFSTDGTKLFDVSDRLRIWDWQKSHPAVRSLVHHSKRINDVVFDGSGNHLAAASDDGTASIWDANTGKLVATTEASQTQGGSFKNLEFCAHDSCLITAGGFVEPTAWDSQTGKVRVQLAFQERDKTTPVIGDQTVVATSGNRFVVASGSSPGWSILGDVDSLTTVKAFSVPDAGINAVAFNAKGELFALADATGRVGLYQSDKGDLVKKFDGSSPLQIVEFSANNELLTVDGKGVLDVWDLTYNTRVQRLNEGGAFINAAKFSPDGSSIAASTVDGKLLFWSTQNPGQAQTWSEEKPPNAMSTLGPPIDMNSLSAVPRGLLAVDFSPDGKFVAAGTDDGAVCIWDCATGKQLLRHFAIEERVTALHYSPDGHLLAYGTDAGNLYLWDVERINKPPAEVAALVSKVISKPSGNGSSALPLGTAPLGMPPPLPPAH